jgi:hypothetical protein
MFTALQRLLPRAVDWYTERVLRRQLHRDEPEHNPEGALHEAGRDGRVRGDHPGYVMKSSLYTRAVIHPAITAGVLAAIGLAAAVALCGPDRRERITRAALDLVKS